jgi:hypothetical protein
MTMLLSVGVVAVVVSSQQSSNCVTSLVQEVSACFTEHGLHLDDKLGGEKPDPTTLMRETQSMDPREICQ